MRYLLRSSSFLALFYLLALALPAQERPQTSTVTGRIVDQATGAPLATVNVFLAGTTIGTATDADGNFKIAGIPLGSHELVVSHIGYEMQQMPLRFLQPTEQNYNFRLRPRIIDLPEVAISAADVKE